MRKSQHKKMDKRCLIFLTMFPLLTLTRLRKHWRVSEVQSVQNAINENIVLSTQSPQGMTSQELQSIEMPLSSASLSQELQTCRIAYVTTKQHFVT